MLDYNPETGELRWKYRPEATGQWNGKWVGKIAGTHNVNGYIVIQISGRIYCAHRLAWLVHHGEWPAHHIDHINGIRDDNRMANLRDATNQLIQQNRKSANKNNQSSGLLGVSWFAPTGEWQANIRHNGIAIALGHFSDKRAARRAYLEAKRRLHHGWIEEARPAPGEKA